MVQVVTSSYQLTNSEYLKSLSGLIEKDSSQIKILIEDLPNLLLNSKKQSNEPRLLFSSLFDPIDRKLLCQLLNLLVKRLNVSARRSKQAFTTMWDKLKQCLELILQDALSLVNEIDNELEILLRRILQLGDICDTKTAIEASVENISLWLAMDLDVQLKMQRFTRWCVFNHLEGLDSELNQKTLFLYFQQFQETEYLKLILEITDPSADLINLYFKKYYSTEITSEMIKKYPELNLEFINNLKLTQSSEWIKFDGKVIEILLSKMKLDSNTKGVCATFDLLTEITVALDLRPDNRSLLMRLHAIQSSMNIEGLSDSPLSKFWCFMAALLSCDGIGDFYLENGIIFTLKSENLVKSKTSVCRVIALYWNKLVDGDLIAELLMDSIIKHDNNKLRWNIAIALMNIEGSNLCFNRIKEFWMGELVKLDNFKVILSYTKLLLKWSNEYDSCIASNDCEVETMWDALSRLKRFIKENELNLECEDGEILVENAHKLELLLKSILIGGNEELN